MSAELTVLRRIVGLWDSLDAIGPEVPAAPLKEQMDTLINDARELLEREPTTHNVWCYCAKCGTGSMQTINPRSA